MSSVIQPVQNAAHSEPVTKTTLKSVPVTNKPSSGNRKSSDSARTVLSRKQAVEAAINQTG